MLKYMFYTNRNCKVFKDESKTMYNMIMVGKNTIPVVLYQG